MLLPCPPGPVRRGAIQHQHASHAMFVPDWPRPESACTAAKRVLESRGASEGRPWEAHRRLGCGWPRPGTVVCICSHGPVLPPVIRRSGARGARHAPRACSFRDSREQPFRQAAGRACADGSSGQAGPAGPGHPRRTPASYGFLQQLPSDRRRGSWANEPPPRCPSLFVAAARLVRQGAWTSSTASAGPAGRASGLSDGPAARRPFIDLEAACRPDPSPAPADWPRDLKPSDLERRRGEHYHAGDVFASSAILCTAP